MNKMRIQSINQEPSASSAQTSASFAVKKNALIILLVIPSFFASAQTEKISQTIIEVAEEMAADDTDPEAVAAYTDRLHELADDPVNINSSNENELSKLFFLSDFQVKSILDYNQSKGPIVSVFEIANIPGFDKETAIMISPFIQLGNQSPVRRDSSRLRNQIITNVSIKPGTSDTSSLGSQLKVLTKYRFTTGNITGGFTLEKDAGEKLFYGTPPLPDFLSGYFAYQGRGIVKKIIAGDYSARFGQGTNINTGIRRGLSLISSGYMSASDEIRPYTSSYESGFLRGIATQLSLKNLDLYLFYSKNSSDATLASSSGLSNDYFEAFYKSGVHNTPLLLNKKDAISENIYGLSLTCNFNHFKSGISYSTTSLSLPIRFTDRDLLKIFDFQGLKSNLFSVYYNLLIRKILFFGECSANNRSDFAIVQGVSMRPSDRLTINTIFRSYKPGFTSFYGYGPGTGSKTANQTGVTANFTFEAAKHIFVSGGSEITYYPWMKYRCSSPSLGARREMMVKYLPGNISIDVSYKYALTINDNDDLKGVNDQEKYLSRSVKTSIHYTINKLVLGFRGDYKFVNPSGSRGFLLSQDINYSFNTIPVTLWFRYCLFDTEDWDSRIYTYENDLLYSFSIPALSGNGSRNYLMIKWKISHFSEIRLKYGITSIAVPGSSRNTYNETDELKMQFRIRF